MIYGQCYTATYSITQDYSKQDIALDLKKKLSKNAQQNKEIYKLIQSSTHSSEWVDSIATICESGIFKIEPKVISKSNSNGTFHLVYDVASGKHCFAVQKPKYLDCWEITGPIIYGNSNDRYYRAQKAGSNDYVIFDSEVPVNHNVMLIQQIPGLVVEAFLHNATRIVLLDFRSSSCSALNDYINQIEAANCIDVKYEEDIDIGAFINPFTDLISNKDFQCVQSFR